MKLTTIRWILVGCHTNGIDCNWVHIFSLISHIFFLFNLINDSDSYCIVCLYIRKNQVLLLVFSWFVYSLLIRGLVKKFCLLPRKFLVVKGSVLKIGMDTHWTFTYTQEKLCIDNFTTFLYVTSEVKKNLVHRKQ